MGHRMVKKERLLNGNWRYILFLIDMIRKNIQVSIQLPPPSQIQLIPKKRRVSQFLKIIIKKKLKIMIKIFSFYKKRLL